MQILQEKDLVICRYYAVNSGNNGKVCNCREPKTRHLMKQLQYCACVADGRTFLFEALLHSTPQTLALSSCLHCCCVLAGDMAKATGESDLSQTPASSFTPSSEVRVEVPRVMRACGCSSVMEAYICKLSFD